MKSSSLAVLAGQVIGVRLLPQQLWAGDYGLQVPRAEHEDIVQKLIPWQFLLQMCHVWTVITVIRVCRVSASLKNS